MIARIGGEEFLIVMPGAPLMDAQGAARRLCHLIGMKQTRRYMKPKTVAAIALH